MAKSGDKCGKCNKGRLKVASSCRSCGGTYQIRLLKCDSCGDYHDERQVVLAENVRRRKFDD